VSKCRWACNETNENQMQKVLSQEFPLDHAFTVPIVANVIIVHASSSMPDFSSVSSMSYSSTLSDLRQQISLSPCPSSNSPCPPCPSHLPCPTRPSTTACPDPTVQECKSLHSLNFCQECECLHVVPTKLQCDFYFPLAEEITPSLCLEKFP
jgi:hypothetical protein